VIRGTRGGLSWDVGVTFGLINGTGGQWVIEAGPTKKAMRASKGKLPGNMVVNTEQL